MRAASLVSPSFSSTEATCAERDPRQAASERSVKREERKLGSYSTTWGTPAEPQPARQIRINIRISSPSGRIRFLPSESFDAQGKAGARPAPQETPNGVGWGSCKRSDPPRLVRGNPVHLSGLARRGLKSRAGEAADAPERDDVS